MRELWELLLVFAKIGGFTFGGGYAMLPILEREVVDRRGWATSEELMDYYAIGQCTPGIIAINTATFIGYKRKGIPGGIAATFGCVAPSLVIIMIIAAFLNSFTDIVWVQHALAGIRVCVCVLVLSTVIRLGRQALTDIIAWVMFALILLASLLTSLPSFVWVLCAGAAGVVIKTLQERRKAGREA